MNPEPVRQFIREHRFLFWDIREDAKENLSQNALVETILKYGHVSDIRQLFQLFGIKQVSEIFHAQISRKRVPYPKRTETFFKLYFKKHVS